MSGSFKLSLGVILLLSNCGVDSIAAPKIAIVGGGIGGASVSHYLNELFNGELNIDLYEAEELGGRLATINIAENEYEIGGEVIHRSNLLMRNFTDLLGLEKRSTYENTKFAIWNNEEFVFEQREKFFNLNQLFYRYTQEPLGLYKYVNSFLEDFSKIYQLQDEGMAFDNVTALLSTLNVEFPNMLRISTKDHLSNLGYSSRLIDEYVEAIVVANYGQNTDVHSFVGCISILAGGTGLWSIKGGNKNIPQQLICRNRRLKVVPSVVKKIVHLSRNNESPMYELHYEKNGSSGAMKRIYDIVILATPLTRDQKMPIEFSNFPKNVNLEFSGSYQATIVTIVQGDLNIKYFNLTNPIDILSCDPEKTIISSVMNINTIDEKCSNVWKIFSRDPLGKNIIDDMFTKIEQTKSMRWKAYPKYTGEKHRSDFKLYDSLYYVNAIEWAASAMEMSAIGGRNVAIMAYNEYKNRFSTEKDLREGEPMTKRRKLLKVFGCCSVF